MTYLPNRDDRRATSRAQGSPQARPQARRASSGAQRRATKRRKATSRGPHATLAAGPSTGSNAQNRYRPPASTPLGSMAHEVRGTRDDRPAQVRQARRVGARSRDMAQMRGAAERRMNESRVRTVRRNNARKTSFPFKTLIAVVSALLVIALVRLVFFPAPGEVGAPDTRLSAAIASADDIFVSPYDWDKLETDDRGRVSYVDGGQTLSRAGIDVSSHSGTIDWKKVAADGIDFAYVRVGYRGTVEGNIAEDTSFEKNFREAQEAGLDVGVYFFSEAINEDEAIEEAQFVMGKLGSTVTRYPIAFDMEPSSSGSDRISSLSKAKRNAVARAFCRELASHGQKAIVYGSRSDLSNYELDDLIDYGFWFADYSSRPQMSLRMGIWQYSDSATVDGIKEKVDLDLDLMGVLATS